MTSIPKKVSERLTAGIKRFQPILEAAKSRDVGESDTVTIIKDMLQEVFGYDKYTEVTSEYAIRGTYCDLATKIEGTLQTLIEVKAIGLDLKDSHVKQAVDYATNQGVDWVLLTNGISWRVYHVIFAKPIDQELVIDIDFCALNPRSEKDIELLYLWCKEGWVRSVLGDYHIQKQALSRFFLGSIILSDSVVDNIRRQLRRLSPDVRVDNDQIKSVLVNEVIKRDVMEGDKADEARKKIAKAESKANKAKEKTSSTSPEIIVPPANTRDEITEVENTGEQGAAANPQPLRGWGCSDAQIAADCDAKLVTAFRVAELDVSSLYNESEQDHKFSQFIDRKPDIDESDSVSTLIRGLRRSKQLKCNYDLNFTIEKLEAATNQSDIDEEE